MREKLYIYGIISAAIVLVVDQWSKYFVFDILTKIDGAQINILPFFNLVMVENRGVSFGMFNQIANGQIILSIVAIAITLILCYFMFTAKNKLPSMALGLIIGGAIGNTIDRIRVGAVADFLDFYFGNYHWPAFNIADSAVFVGVVILLVEEYL